MPAEDRMQAFLWRHLVEAEEDQIKAWVYDATYKAPPRRVKTFVPPHRNVDAVNMNVAM